MLASGPCPLFLIHLHAASLQRRGHPLCNCCSCSEGKILFAHLSHVRVFSDSRNVQKRATKSDSYGHCLVRLRFLQHDGAPQAVGSPRASIGPPSASAENRAACPDTAGRRLALGAGSSTPATLQPTAAALCASRWMRVDTDSPLRRGFFNPHFPTALRSLALSLNCRKSMNCRKYSPHPPGPPGPLCRLRCAPSHPDDARGRCLRHAPPPPVGAARSSAKLEEPARRALQRESAQPTESACGGSSAFPPGAPCCRRARGRVPEWRAERAYYRRPRQTSPW